MRRAALLVLAAAATACGGGDSKGDDGERTGDAQTARYVAAMEGPMRRMRRAFAGASLDDNRPDFDRGLALLRVRKRIEAVSLARVPPALFVAHDRIEKGLGRAAGYMVARPDSEYARDLRAARVEVGTQTAVALGAGAEAQWYADVTTRLRSLDEPVPAWIGSLGRQAAEQAREAAAVAPRVIEPTTP